jgi:hypothetical protein
MTPKPTHIKALSGTGLIVLFIALACALSAASESLPAGDVNITIINPQSYPTVGGNWTVTFNTTGAADLWITAVNGTEFNKDLEFIEVRCGNEIMNYEFINNSILIRDYECSETGTETADTFKKESASGGIKYLKYYQDTEDTPSVATVSIKDQQENPYELRYLIDAGFFMGIKK